MKNNSKRLLGCLPNDTKGALKTMIEKILLKAGLRKYDRKHSDLLGFDVILLKKGTYGSRKEFAYVSPCCMGRPTHQQMDDHVRQCEGALRSHGFKVIHNPARCGPLGRCDNTKPDVRHESATSWLYIERK